MNTISETAPKDIILKVQRITSMCYTLNHYNNNINRGKENDGEKKKPKELRHILYYCNYLKFKKMLHSVIEITGEKADQCLRKSIWKKVVKMRKEIQKRFQKMLCR